MYRVRCPTSAPLVQIAALRKVLGERPDGSEWDITVPQNRRPIPKICGARTGKASMKGLLCLLFLVLAGCDDRPGEWSSIVYPDKTDRTKFQVTARFKTLNYCLTNALDQMNAIQVSTGGDYECGRNCGVSGDPHKGNICEETHK